MHRYVSPTGEMQILSELVRRYVSEKPLQGKKVLVCTHLKETTVRLAQALVEVGAEVYYYPIDYSLDSSLETLVEGSASTIVRTEGDVVDLIPRVDMVLEDGARISKLIARYPDLALKEGFFSIEQTTNGHNHWQGTIPAKYPIVSVARSTLKTVLENGLATPESIVTTLLCRIPISLAGKAVLLVGYGSVGTGLAKLLGAHGAVVTVCDTDPVRRIVAQSCGFRSVVSSAIASVLPVQDLVISCTDKMDGGSFGLEQALLAKDGAVFLNAGSGFGEYAPALRATGEVEVHHSQVAITLENDDIRISVTKYGNVKRMVLLGSGYPLNLRMGRGTATDAIDYVFSMMFLVACRTDAQNLHLGLCPVERRIEAEIVDTMTDKASRAPLFIRSEELRTEERPYGSLEKFGTEEVKDLHFSVVRASFQPGSSTEGHYHLSSQEAYFVESGSAVVTLWFHEKPAEQIEREMKKGDYLVIPEGFVHQVRVPAGVPFVCLVIASPPFSFWDQFFPS